METCAIIAAIKSILCDNLTALLSRAVTFTFFIREKNAERCTQGRFSSYQQVRMSCRIHKFAFENYFIIVNSEHKRTRLTKIGGQGVFHESLAVGTVTCI